MCAVCLLYSASVLVRWYVCRLDEEIEDFSLYMCPLPEERLMRQKVIERVTGLITELWPSAKVHLCETHTNIMSFLLFIVRPSAALVPLELSDNL